MPRIPKPISSKPHRVFTLHGHKIMCAYEGGEIQIEVLERLGTVGRFSFTSIPQLNAFIRGCETFGGLVVDDLI